MDLCDAFAVFALEEGMGALRFLDGFVRTWILRLDLFLDFALEAEDGVFFLGVTLLDLP
jgi:hypothetical protein